MNGGTKNTLKTLGTLAAIFALRMVVDQSNGTVNHPVVEAAIAAESELVHEGKNDGAEPVEAQAEQDVRQPPKSQFSYEAELVYTALRRYYQAAGYDMSKTSTREELNEACWENRPKMQGLQNRHDGGKSVHPDDLVNHTSLLNADLICRLAFHYEETNTTPPFSRVDISELEGDPNVAAEEEE